MTVAGDQLFLAVRTVASGEHALRVLADAGHTKVAKAAKKVSRLERGVGHVGGTILGAPFRGVGDAIASTLLGRKATSGPFKGKRVVPVRGGPGVGLDEITPSKYTEYRTGARKGKGYAGVIGDKAVFYRRRYSRGGLVGLAQRNPGKAAALAGLAYLMGTNSTARSVGSAMVPLPEGEMNPASKRALEYAQYQPSGVNPLTKETWG